MVTDSQLMLNSMTVWLPGWKKKGWKTAAGKPVKNQDLIMALEAEVNRLGSVRWHWVRGHETGAGNEHKALNDRADQLAVAAVEEVLGGLQQLAAQLGREPGHREHRGRQRRGPSGTRRRPRDSVTPWSGRETISISSPADSSPSSMIRM